MSLGSDFITSLTPDKLLTVLKMNDAEAEQILFDRMRYLDRSQRLTHAERGLILRNVEKFMLYEKRTDPETGTPCSFNRWLKLASPWAYSSCRQALSDVKALTDIPDADLIEVPPSNFHVLKQLSTQVRNEPEVLEAAKTQQAEEFVETIRKEFPLQHIESRKALRFNPEESAVTIIEEALRQAEIRGANNRNEGLELIAQTALEQWLFEDQIKNLPAGGCDEPDTENPLPTM